MDDTTPNGRARGKSSHRRPVTAGEFLDQLERDPAHQKRAAEREQQIRTNRERYRFAARPVLADLAAAGFKVDSVGELVERRRPYPTAVPILLEWLPRATYDSLRLDIVVALAVPWAKPIAARPLVGEFRRTNPIEYPGLRWAIGNALEVVADESVADELLRLAQDTRYGRDREMIVMALGKLQHPDAIPILSTLLHDDQVAGHAVIALGRLRATEARTNLEPFLAHPRAWIRKEARLALARIERAMSGPSGKPRA